MYFFWLLSSAFTIFYGIVHPQILMKIYNKYVEKLEWHALWNIMFQNNPKNSDTKRKICNYP